MHSRATTEGVRPNARENSQIRPSTIVRAARAAGSHPHLASVLLQGLKSANIYATSGVIRGIPVYYQYYWDSPAAEDDLAYTKARRDKARKEREETGKSDVGARLRLEEECTRAIERGVEDNVRRSYGCGD